MRKLLFSLISRLGFRGRLFASVAVLFAVLVAAHVHGSSIALSSKFWAPQENHFLAKSLVDKAAEKFTGTSLRMVRAILQADPKETRSDEWSISTMWALSQFNHVPRFPVHNQNIGLGQNMLVVSWVPVWHFSVIARPVTWGYMLFGQQAGLAWYWWFSPFFCFVTLYLVIEILLPGDRFLATLGAFWFSASAYAIAWSHYPSYLVGFANLTLLGAYALLRAQTSRKALLGGALLGYGSAGVIKCLYIPWIVPLAYLYAAMVIGLVIRDDLLKRIDRRALTVGLAAAVVTCGAIAGSFLWSSYADLHALATSSYPGIRRLSGGDCSLARLFGGFYNFLTLRKPFLKFPASEWAGYFLFLPTVIFGALFTRRVRRRFDAVAWLLLCLVIVLALYSHAGFPQWLANLMLFSRFQGYRAQLATGMGSILLSLYLLRRVAPLPKEPDGQVADEPSPSPPTPSRGARFRKLVLELGRSERTMAVAALACSLIVYLALGSSLHVIAKLYRSKLYMPWQVWLVSSAAAATGTVLFFGYRRIFAAVLIPALLVTAGDFNPLSRGYAALESTEMWRAIQNVNAVDKTLGRKSMWLASGGPHLPIIGTTVSAMGGRSMTGVFYHPQLALWHTLDPERAQEFIYNRYSESHYFPLTPGDPTVRFTLPGPANFNVRVAPDNPKLASLGARYAITYDRHTPYETSGFKRIYISDDGRLRIYQLQD